MKRLKTITTALLLLFTVTAFSQTKEETLEWLKRNGMAILNIDCYYKYDDGSGENHGFVYTFTSDYFTETWYIGGSIYNKKKVYYKDIAYVEDISSLSVKIELSNVHVCGNTSEIYQCSFPINKFFEKDGTENTSPNFYINYSDSEGSSKNIKKFLRALMHMAKLHGAEPYKDLFGE